MIDRVHDVAGSYRRLIDANSYPGDIYSIEKFYRNNSLEVPFYEGTLLFVYMLLDAEVTFSVVGENSTQVGEFISRMTYAKQVDSEEADFIFILSTATGDQIRGAIASSSGGTLEDPHLSASIIYEVRSVKDGKQEIISGPGIQKEKKIRLSCGNWQEARYAKNIEYPLGIEIYFLDEDGDILALPRTTQVKGCV